MNKTINCDKDKNKILKISHFLSLFFQTHIFRGNTSFLQTTKETYQKTSKIH